MKKMICFSLLSLNLLNTACQPGPANPIPSSGLNRILTITSETQDPKLPKILVPGLELKVFAGSGKAGYKNGPKLEAEFTIGGIAQDDEGNLYVSDYQDLRIRKIDIHGQVSTLAGTGEKVLNGKMGSFAETQFYSVGDLFYKHPHQLYVSDFEAKRLFRLNLDTQRSELFMIEAQYTPPERLPTLDTSVLPIVFGRPGSLAVYKGDLYLEMSVEIWKLTQSNQRYHLERYAGNADVRGGGSIDDAERYFKDGPPDDSIFNGIGGLAFDRDGNLYVSDIRNQRIRKVAAGTREVSTFSGQGIPTSNRSIDKDFVGGFQDGRLNEAQFAYPGPLALTEAGDMFVLDSNEGGALRWISQGHVKTLFQNCSCTLLKDERKNTLYVASYKNQQIYTLDLSQLEKLKPQISKQEPKP